MILLPPFPPKEIVVYFLEVCPMQGNEWKDSLEKRSLYFLRRAQERRKGVLHERGQQDQDRNIENSELNPHEIVDQVSILIQILTSIQNMSAIRIM